VTNGTATNDNSSSTVAATEQEYERTKTTSEEHRSANDDDDDDDVDIDDGTARNQTESSSPSKHKRQQHTASSSSSSSVADAVDTAPSADFQHTKFGVAITHHVTAFITWPQSPEAVCSSGDDRTVVGYQLRYRRVGDSDYVSRYVTKNLLILNELMAGTRYRYQLQYVTEPPGESLWSQEAELDTSDLQWSTILWHLQLNAGTSFRFEMTVTTLSKLRSRKLDYLSISFKSFLRIFSQDLDNFGWSRFWQVHCAAASLV